MRVLVDVTTMATELPWEKVIAPGRGLIYRLIEQSAPTLCASLHETGWGPHRMVPIGFGAPLFPHAARRRGAYAVGGPGILEFGSPLEYVAEAIAASVSERAALSWGGMTLKVERVGTVEPPDFANGRARMRTRTPVVMKGRDPDLEDGPTTWVLPDERHFATHFQHNLVRKAETLGLTPRVKLESILHVGPKRSFAVGKKNGAKPGATIEVELVGDPKVLRALWCWGLGQANAAGFGWIEDTV